MIQYGTVTTAGFRWLRKGFWCEMGKD